MLALAGVARADKLVETNLDVAVPAAWTESSIYSEPADGVDELIYAGPRGAVGPTVMISRAARGDGLSAHDDCVARLEGLAAGDPESSLQTALPAWAPSGFVPRAVRSPQGTSERTKVCTAGPDGYVIVVAVILMSASSAYETATPLLEAIAQAREWGHVEVTAPAEKTEETPIYAPAPEPDGDDRPAPGAEPEAEAPPLALIAVLRRPLRVGIGAAYLDARKRDAGYGLAVSVGYDFGLGTPRLRGHVRGIAGFDSSAGVWAEGRALLVTQVATRYGVALAALLGGGIDGIGRSNDDMKLAMGYAPSFQVGGRATRIVADGGYELEGTGAIRASDDGAPDNALRFRLARLWSSRRLAAVSVGYTRYTNMIGQVTAMVAFRL